MLPLENLNNLSIGQRFAYIADYEMERTGIRYNLECSLIGRIILSIFFFCVSKPENPVIARWKAHRIYLLAYRPTIDSGSYSSWERAALKVNRMLPGKKAIFIPSQVVYQGYDNRGYYPQPHVYHNTNPTFIPVLNPGFPVQHQQSVNPHLNTAQTFHGLNNVTYSHTNSNYSSGMNNNRPNSYMPPYNPEILPRSTHRSTSVNHNMGQQPHGRQNNNPPQNNNLPSSVNLPRVQNNNDGTGVNSRPTSAAGMKRTNNGNKNY